MGRKLSVSAARRLYLADNGEGADALSLGLRARIETEWKERVRHLPPADRAAWLRRPEAIAALGARRCGELATRADRMRTWLQESAPSGPWIEASHEDQFPIPGMVRSHAEVRFGEEGRPTFRYLPPQCAAEEDYLDSLSVFEAIIRQHRFPASCSAVAIQRIESSLGRERTGSGGRGPLRRVDDHTPANSHN